MNKYIKLEIIKFCAICYYCDITIQITELHTMYPKIYKSWGFYEKLLFTVTLDVSQILVLLSVYITRTDCFNEMISWSRMTYLFSKKLG